MFRFTPFGLKLSEGMRILIALYYTLKDIPNINDEDPQIKNIIVSFLGALFGKCKSLGNNNEYLVTGVTAFARWHYIETFCQPITVDKSELKTFVNFMGRFYKTINEAATKPRVDIILNNISYGASTKIDYQLAKPFEKEIPGVDDLDELNKQVGQKLRQERAKYWGDKITMKIIKRRTLNALTKQKLQIEKLKYGEVKTQMFKLMKVESCSDFGSCILALYTDDTDTSMNKYQGIIKSLDYPSWSSFLQIVQSFFIEYRFEFINFNRIKICETCAKIFFEKKEGAGLCCSGSCRKKHFVKNQPLEKFKCRHRQNVWIHSHGNEISTLSRGDCKRCKKYEIKIKGGQCHIVTDRTREEAVRKASLQSSKSLQ